MDNQSQEPKKFDQTVDFALPNDFRSRLETVLKLRRMEQAELARLVGVSPAMICHIKYGRKKPSYLLMLKIAKVLEVDSAILFGSPYLEKTREEKND